MAALNTAGYSMPPSATQGREGSKKVRCSHLCRIEESKGERWKRIAESEIEKKRGPFVDRVGIHSEVASRDARKRRSCRKSERIKKRYYEQICTAFNARVSSSGENGM